jgi:Tol biopolymer transport system component
MITSPLLSAEDNFETFPCFSPDGNILYFCSADRKKLPGEYDQMKYSLCSISFDFADRSFGARTDTLISSAETGKSISIPRISPDGKFIMFTMSDFGCFPSFNPEADLWILNLENNEYYNVDAVNSNYTESYHSWSSDGHWVVFSSRRIDGLYMNIYFAFVDEDGSIRKPFLLPQRNPDFYDKFLFSFNIPEFVTKKVGIDPYEIEKVAKSTITIQVQTGSSH